MQVQKTDNTNFGMAIICKQNENVLRNYMFNKFNASQYRKVNEAMYLQRNNPIDIYLSVINKNGKDKIEAEVGPKTFKENFITNGAKVITKAVKYANKLNAEQIKINKNLKDFNAPRLDM